MSTLGQLKTKLTYALGTSETNLFTPAKRTDAINKAVEHVLQLYPIPQYTLQTTLSFIAGVADLPTDFIRSMKLWNSGMQLEYVMIHPNDFDGNVSYTFTIKWDNTLPVPKEKVYLYPADTIALDFRYIQMPVDMTSDSDTIRLPERWDDGIAALAARFLFLDTNEPNRAQQAEALAKEHYALAWSIESARFQDPRFTRLESKFESMPILSHTVDNWHTS